jgi:16S rRNA (guanine1207-N2)-methyltransferase
MPHYYDEEQETPLVPRRITVSARGHTLELWTGAGVFSKDALDRGTKLLIDACILAPGWKIHDLGCGIGVVGIIVKKVEPSSHIIATDVSRRAIELAQKNIGEHAPDIQVRLSDGYMHVPEIFDTVLVNPPYVAGRQTIYRLIDEAYGHLRPGGVLQLVARHAKGGETLKKRLAEVFGNCDDSRRASGFRLYISKK